MIIGRKVTRKQVNVKIDLAREIHQSGIIRLYMLKGNIGANLNFTGG